MSAWIGAGRQQSASQKEPAMKIHGLAQQGQPVGTVLPGTHGLQAGRKLCGEIACQHLFCAWIDKSTVRNAGLKYRRRNGQRGTAIYQFINQLLHRFRIDIQS